MAEILSPLFLPIVRQKYLSAGQKTNTGPGVRVSGMIRVTVDVRVIIWLGLVT